jgi:two-component system, chemotaxis family, chemotaxis protein CheV
VAHNILLESGTNEMELLVFRVGEGVFGINVAKVRELTQRIPVITVPHAPDAIEGSIRLREEILTLINLARYLGISSDPNQEGLIIVVEVNNTRCGVLADAVEMIHRLSWDRIDPPSSYIASLNTPVTATATVDERVVLILDFERILAELLGTGGVDVPQSLDSEPAEGGGQARILVADDSPIIRDAIEKVLRMANFSDITLCGDGEEAWREIENRRSNGGIPFDFVLSDIEMPAVDGLALTARIKGEPGLASMPVALFSSIINDDTANKGRSVGADAQFAKTDTAGLIAWLRGRMRESGGGSAQ